MKKYEYRFVKVSITRTNKGIFNGVETGDTFESCRDIIEQEAQKGWRLKQIVVPYNEKMTNYSPICYQIIFEREVE